MPELQALYEEMQDQDINVVGIVADGMKNKEAAVKLIEQQGVTYTNIIADQKFIDDFVNMFSFVPVAVFVNNNGELLGEEVGGALTKEEFQQVIEEKLNS